MSFISLENAAAHMGVYGFAYASLPSHETDWAPTSERYNALKAESPRTSLCQKFLNGVTKFVQRVVTWVRGAGSLPCLAMPIAQKSLQSAGYIRKCEESIKALEFAWSSDRDVDLIEGLTQFCLCRRDIANMQGCSQNLNDSATFDYLNRLRTLLTPHLERLEEFVDCLEDLLETKKPSINTKIDPKYMHMVLKDLLEFGHYSSGKLTNFPTI